MLNLELIDKLLLLHQEFRESFKEDFASDDKKYEVLCMLLEKEVKGTTTFNLKKDNYFLNRILEFDSRYNEFNILDSRVHTIWKKSIGILFGSDSNIINPNRRIQIEVLSNQSILDIGESADINRKKTEFNKLKIQYMNNKRRD